MYIIFYEIFNNIYKSVFNYYKYYHLLNQILSFIGPNISLYTHFYKNYQKFHKNKKLFIKDK